MLKLILIKKNSPFVKKKVKLTALKSGTVNSIRICTETDLINGMTLGECDQYCPFMIIPTKEFAIKKGESKILEISYEMGGEMLDIKHKIY